MRPACFLAGGLAAPARINASNARRHRGQHDWLTRAGVHRRRLWSRRKQTICSRWRECARGRARDGKMNQPRRGASCVNALPQSTTAWMSAYSIIGRSCMLSPMPKRGRLPAAMNVLMQSTLPSPIEYGASSSIDVTNHPSCCAEQSISREDRSASWLFARRFPAKRSQSRLEQRSPLKNR